MKKKYVILFVFVIIFVTGFYVSNLKSRVNNDNVEVTQSELEKYNSKVATFIKIEPKNLTKKIKEIQNTESFFVYFGRPTCVYCREFVPKLEKYKNEFMTKEVYYVDTEDTKKNKELSDLRDSYGVKFVPSLLYFSNENEYLTYDMNSGDLKEFLGDK